MGAPIVSYGPVVLTSDTRASPGPVPCWSDAAREGVVVPVPLPGETAVDRSRPGPAETVVLARGVASAVAGPGGLTPLQDVLIRALFRSMTGHDVDPTAVEPISPAAFAQALARREAIFRERIVQLMVLCELVLTPLPAGVA
jgi:hypothetical protein